MGSGSCYKPIPVGLLKICFRTNRQIRASPIDLPLRVFYRFRSPYKASNMRECLSIHLGECRDACLRTPVARKNDQISFKRCASTRPSSLILLLTFISTYPSTPTFAFSPLSDAWIHVMQKKTKPPNTHCTPNRPSRCPDR